MVTLDIEKIERMMALTKVDIESLSKEDLDKAIQKRYEMISNFEQLINEIDNEILKRNGTPPFQKHTLKKLLR
jgi:hypothetical protein